MAHRGTRRDVLLALAGAATVPRATAARPATGRAECEWPAVSEEDAGRISDEIAARLRRIVELQAAAVQPRFPSETRDRARDVGLAARESVVVLDTVGTVDGAPFLQGWATAWFVSEEYLLTNAHNVGSDFETLYGVTVDGETFEMELVDSVVGDRPDVALLRADFAGTPLPVGDSRSLARDDPLVQVGHPGDFGYWVIALGGYLKRESPNDLSATIAGLSGNSGSPILNLSGDVVAMTYGGEAQTGSPSEGPTDDEVRVGLLAADPTTSAVPIETAIERMEEWT